MQFIDDIFQIWTYVQRFLSRGFEKLEHQRHRNNDRKLPYTSKGQVCSDRETNDFSQILDPFAQSFRCMGSFLFVYVKTSVLYRLEFVGRQEKCLYGREGPKESSRSIILETAMILQVKDIEPRGFYQSQVGVTSFLSWKDCRKGRKQYTIAHRGSDDVEMVEAANKTYLKFGKMQNASRPSLLIRVLKSVYLRTVCSAGRGSKPFSKVTCREPARRYTVISFMIYELRIITC